MKPIKYLLFIFSGFASLLTIFSQETNAETIKRIEEYKVLQDSEFTFQKRSREDANRWAYGINNAIERIDRKDFDEWVDLINIFQNRYNQYESANNFSNRNYGYFRRFVSKYTYERDLIHFDFVADPNSRIIAQAVSPLQDDIRILINIDQWESLNNYQRAWMLMHEFAHEAYGLEHGKGGSLMYPLMPDELEELTWNKELNRLLIHMDENPKKYESFSPFYAERHFNRIRELEKIGVPFNVSFFNPKTKIYVSKAFDVMVNAVFDFFDYISSPSYSYDLETWIHIDEGSLKRQPLNEELEIEIMSFGAKSYDGKN